MSGWISIHRKIQDHWVWKEKPFTKGQAWIDILLLVNHADNKVFFDNEILLVKRGEHITSEPKLAERWGWSRTKVRNFLKLLEKDLMIENKKEDRKRTRLTVLNYEDYQILEDNRKTREDTTREQEKNRTETGEKQEEDINNNDNNDNKNIYSANFEKMWGLYPNKKGKGQVSDSKKKEIFMVGEEFERCISRYKAYVEKERENGFKDLKYQNGSTFFNSGYVDYLDKNYKGDIEKTKVKRPPLKMVIRDNY